MTLQPSLCCVLVSKTKPPASLRENWRSRMMMIWASTEPILCTLCARPFKVNLILIACHRRGNLKFCSKIWYPNPGRLLWNMCPWSSHHHSLGHEAQHRVQSVDYSTRMSVVWGSKKESRMAMVGSLAKTGILAVRTIAYQTVGVYVSLNHTILPAHSLHFFLCSFSFFPAWIEVEN